MIRAFGTLLASLALTACATVPSAVIRYYPPKANLTLTVTQAVDCNAAKSTLVTSNSVADAVAYSADYGAGYHEFHIKQSNGALADTNVTFNLTEDGRLKSVNGDSTGQVEAFAKSVITVAAAALPLLGGAPPAPPPGQLAECDIIAKWGGGKPVTLTYVQVVPFAKGAPGTGSYKLVPDPSSQPLYAKLRAHLPNLVLTVGSPSTIEKPVILDKGADTGPSLTLNQTASVHLSLAEAASPAAWSADIIVPLADSFEVPLPKAASFGKVSFALTLAESGAVTTLTYGQVSGAAGAANVAAAAATAAKPDTAADRAAKLKGEADEIAQNARVARCRADPTSCN